jgi:undecaprenyl-diphosphatase
VPILTADTRRRIAAFDTRVDRAFDRLRGNPASDRLFYAASELGDFSLIWLIIGATRGLRPSDRDWHAAMRVGGGLLVESVLVNGIIKSFFRRSRPSWERERPRPLRRPRTSSFPSGHASSAFTAAGLLAEDDALWPLYYAIAVVVASSRVYVKVHHASDIVVGAAIGLALGRIGRKLVPLPPES